MIYNHKIYKRYIKSIGESNIHSESEFVASSSLSSSKSQLSWSSWYGGGFADVEAPWVKTLANLLSKFIPNLLMFVRETTFDRILFLEFGKLCNTDLGWIFRMDSLVGRMETGIFGEIVESGFRIHEPSLWVVASGCWAFSLLADLNLFGLFCSSTTFLRFLTSLALFSLSCEWKKSIFNWI